MPAINTTLQLAKVRSKIDNQQRIIDQLEIELQMSILGSPNTATQRSTGALVRDIQNLYDSVQDGSVLGASFKRGVENFYEDKNGNIPDLNAQVPEQDVIRSMLSQARAILGELRIEEQSYVAEVNNEKELRKALTDFAKA